MFCVDYIELIRPESKLSEETRKVYDEAVIKLKEQVKKSNVKFLVVDSDYLYRTHKIRYKEV